MSPESQSAMLILIVIVVLSIGHLRGKLEVGTLPDPSDFPKLIATFMMILLTIFYGFRAFFESLKILLWR